ncbi:MAG: hypothetical protein EZS28_026959 [Streblomastix strix]|uniref:Uncharacterized protein n=1 Tax=Streblomastix strix TaxID=222440 RepID=A0A5J4V570_9EUKA|nr:MAG: hypothetical protein EZS28_026959 [Streblomastix strix]
MLYWMWMEGNKKMKMLMYNKYQFLGYVIEGLRCAGGNEEEHEIVAWHSISTVRQIYLQICNRVGIQNGFFELKKDFESQIEEFGDREELESHIFHLVVLGDKRVIEDAKYAQKTITMAYRHPTNGHNLYDWDEIDEMRLEQELDDDED